MKRTLMTFVAAAVLSACTAAQSYGPGMMSGQGPGMMGGYGPGMMGYGPGMMGGYGPGMMGGYGGGPGPGGWGPGMGGQGPGMMGGWGAMGGAWPADLNADQKAKIATAQQDFQKKQWGLMQQMHQLMWSANSPGAGFDEQAARKNYDASAALHKQMFENSIDLRKRIDAVLTPQQREEMQRGWSR